MEGIGQILRGAISTIVHLPEEILLHIFRMVAQELDSRWDESLSRWAMIPKSDRYILLRLSQVCATWRAVIAENSSLAKTVEVRGQFSQKGEERERNLATGWAKAAKTSNLLFINDWGFDQSDVLKTFMGSGPAEWKAIHIVMVHDPVRAGSWDVQAHSAQKVTIVRRSIKTLHYFTPLIRQASVVVLYGPPPKWGSVPWVHLRSLTIHHSAGPEKTSPFLCGSDELTALLLAATELTELTLNFRASRTTLLNNDHPVIMHPNLSSLSLHLHHFVAGKGPFGVELHAPALQKLDFISLWHYVPLTNASFLCSGCPKDLSLLNMDKKEVVVAAELCEWLPDVHSVNVMGRNVDTFFRTLIHHGPVLFLPLPLPKLSSLFIADTDLRGETLIELLESRLRHAQWNTPGVCAITEVKMYNSPAVTPAHWRRVQELLGKGINNLSMVAEDSIEG